MHKLSTLAFAGALVLGTSFTATLAFAESVPVAAGKAAGEITGTVTIVNVEKRMLTIQKPDGHFQVIHIPEEVRRIDEIKINDKLTISYLEAVAVDLKKRAGDAAPSAVATKKIDREASRKPAGSMVETLTISGTVEAVNRSASTVTVRGPENRVTLTVQDPSLLEGVAAGDGVEVTYMKAVAAKVE